MKFINQIFIERPANEVFLFISDATNAPLWNYAVIDSVKITKDIAGEGTVYKQHRKFAGRTLADTFIVDTYTTDKFLSFRSIEAEYPFIIEYAFSSQLNGTLISNTFEMHGKTADGILGDLFKRRVKSAVAANLQKLKELMERKH